jgi:hypothetical protein
VLLGFEFGCEPVDLVLGQTITTKNIHPNPVADWQWQKAFFITSGTPLTQTKAQEPALQTPSTLISHLRNENRINQGLFPYAQIIICATDNAFFFLLITVASREIFSIFALPGIWISQAAVLRRPSWYH